MKIYNRYIISLALMFLLSTVVLSVSNQGLDVYFSVYLIECLAVTLFFSHLNPRARGALNRVEYVLIVGFLVLVAAKVVEIVSGIKIL